MKKFDLIVIGSGSAGSSVIEAAHARGAKVCVIERDAIGGECPNYACVPAKAMLKSAKLYYSTKHHLRKYGVHASNVRFSFSEIMARKKDVVDTITGKGKRLKKFWGDMGVTVVKGNAHFVDAHTVRVGSKLLKAKGFVIATGAVDFIPPIDGIDQVPYLDYRAVTQLRRQPKSIIIVGGGPVGCEFGTFFTLLGTKVTIMQLAPLILHREDEEISLIAEKALKDQKAKVLTQTKVLAVQKDGRGVKVTYQVGEGPRRTMRADALLLAAGKRANIAGLNVEAAGVKLDRKGRLKVSETLQTTAKNIFAAGDVSGGMLFTHMAHHEGMIAGENIVKVLKKKKGLKKRDMRVVPRVTFTLPEVASVGMTTKEAAGARKKFAVGSFPLGALGRAVTEGERVGVVKLVVEKKSRLILGGHAIGVAAGEMIHEVALAMQMGVTVDDLVAMTHAFPTWSEGVLAAASSV
jgi:mercuric reductase